MASLGRSSFAYPRLVAVFFVIGVVLLAASVVSWWKGTRHRWTRSLAIQFTVLFATVGLMMITIAVIGPGD